MRKVLGAAVILCAVAACGQAPLSGLGGRSSDWIGEPTIVTTTTVGITVPIVVRAENLKWFNDTIVSDVPLDDPQAVAGAIFARRAGDFFIQASRAEIASVLPDVRFPATVPYLAEYVTSQLVFDNEGALAKDPVVTFGIWSSEPYTRSRSVAQMEVLRVAFDQETANALQEPDADVTCARFADRTTEKCEASQVEGHPIWTLTAGNGTTVVWFDGPYRYELFGRTFVPSAVLQEMATDTISLGELAPAPG